MLQARTGSLRGGTSGATVTWSINGGFYDSLELSTFDGR